MTIKDLNRIVGDWPVEPGMLQVRKVQGADGQQFVQLRVDLGVLQMAVDGRPDSEKPEGLENMLEVVQRRRRRSGGTLELTPELQAGLVREMLQFYRRRVALMALAKQAQANSDFDEADACYRRAIRDAEHNLAILDLFHELGGDVGEMAEEHEPYRPFILMHRTICQAERALLVHDPDEAIEHIKERISAIELCESEEGDEPGGDFEDEALAGVSPFIYELRRFERQVRKKYRRRRTLSERLSDAVAAEDYEQAARLRDRLAARKREPTGD